jgi:hypothetical protein
MDKSRVQRSSFGQRIRALVASDPMIKAVIDCMLKAWSARWTEYLRLHALLVQRVGRNELRRRFIAIPGIGPVVVFTALMLHTVRKSKTVGAHLASRRDVCDCGSESAPSRRRRTPLRSIEPRKLYPSACVRTSDMIRNGVRWSAAERLQFILSRSQLLVRLIPQDWRQGAGEGRRMDRSAVGPPRRNLTDDRLHRSCSTCVE